MYKYDWLKVMQFCMVTLFVTCLACSFDIEWKKLWGKVPTKNKSLCTTFHFLAVWKMNVLVLSSCIRIPSYPEMKKPCTQFILHCMNHVIYFDWWPSGDVSTQIGILLYKELCKDMLKKDARYHYWWWTNSYSGTSANLSSPVQFLLKLNS